MKIGKLLRLDSWFVCHVHPVTKDRTWNLSVPVYPHADSDADIGFYFAHYKKPDRLYGKFQVGIHFGKYLLELSHGMGLSWCDFFATGCGG